MKDFVRFFVEVIGLKGLIGFFEVPMVTYLPSSKSALKVFIEGEKADLTIVIEFKGDSKYILDEKVNGKGYTFIGPKSFNLVSGEEADRIFEDDKDDLAGKRVIDYLRSEFSRCHEKLDVMNAMIEKEKEELAKRLAEDDECQSTPTKQDPKESQTKADHSSQPERGSSASATAQPSSEEEEK